MFTLIGILFTLVIVLTFILTLEDEKRVRAKINRELDRKFGKR